MVSAYVFDTSALIGAWVRSYPPENFPNFWNNMDAMAQVGRLVVPQEVLVAHPALIKPGTGRNRADPFVIATSLELGMTVVTEERGGSEAKPKIPSVCKALSIDCVSVVELIRRERWTF